MNMQALYELTNSGRIFTAVFKKKTDGTIRKMTCRMGVTKHLKAGGELKFNPYAKHLLPVFDVQKKGYRFINADELISLTVDGVTINFD
jgi:hypothetical protein